MDDDCIVTRYQCGCEFIACKNSLVKPGFQYYCKQHKPEADRMFKLMDKRLYNQADEREIAKAKRNLHDKIMGFIKY